MPDDNVVPFARCKVRVFDGSRDVLGRHCNRDIKTAGAVKCNLHLAGDKRRAANKAAREEESAQRKQAMALMQEKAQVVADLLGIDVARVRVATAPTGSWHPTGRLTIEAGLLEDSIRRLKEGS